MKFKKQWIVILAILFGGIFATTHQTEAAENPGNFSVTPIYPKNQQDESLGYFDLLVAPGQKQTLNVRLTNPSTTARTFEVYINPAVTSDGGTIDYNQRSVKLDPTIPFDVRKVLTLAQHDYKLAAKSSVVIPIQVALPADQFAGRVLAGITVNEKKTSTTDENEGAIQVKNKIAYNIAVVLQESTAAITPDLKLVSGDLAAVNAKTTVQLKFQNPTPTIINHLIFTTKIKRNDKVYVKSTTNEYLVAPNSNFHLNLDLAGDHAQPGDYVAEIVARSGTKYEWKFKYEFTVNQDQANKVNQGSIFVTKDKQTPWWLYLLIALVIVLLFWIFFLLFKRRRKDDEDDPAKLTPTSSDLKTS
ncbi:DUF916 and DUF3324 domain-containing protein [Lapidilactobacillus mulanensis]|uniref:DUF916 and DUF3324 domain-containing protein n=1 Tax=Lapidilactobacillus mulanensis TaxID=2485999 RepID=A0ABW4DQ10_9LACO|nr:DUF916 and DUF3324 domain-containing protein [Lapidilactobacillus mulanensis]